MKNLAEPKICKNCVYIKTCTYYNDNLQEGVSEDYCCPEFEMK